ncbi:FAD-binding oxidoreductase [Microbacterium sp. 2MCAF23]|uniref:FAD-binding oxidoreductase n=1 Tax=Microbacterium sp. 2MCAF23 TaxID=3232985 RepID=UPI003F98C717
MSAPEQHRTASSGLRPSLVVACASERDIAREIGHAAATGMRLVPRGGGHCFAGRSTTDGIVLDLAAMDQVRVDPSGTATIGAGCRLGRVYGALHAVGRTLPAGCGETVGIAGLTLGGGIGLLGRQHGLTCDRLIGARVVLADGDIVDCDEHREPDLFWALRGAGGGQFGVVSTFRFATVPEPMVSRVEVAIPGNVDLGALVTAWQEHAPDAPDGLTVDLVIELEPGVPGLQVRAVGASSLPASVTNAWLRELLGRAGSARLRVEDPVPYSTVNRCRTRP